VSDDLSFGEPVNNGSSQNVETNGEANISSEDLSLASPFLNKIPPEDRAVVARYIKEWDAGVTKKFQEYSGKLKPYEALGPYDEIQQYVNFANNFRRDPENVFRLMWQGIQDQYGDDAEQEIMRILQLEAEMSDEQDYGYEENGEPDPNEVFQQNVSQELEDLRAWRENFEMQQQSAEENQQLDGVLNAMHTRYGDFDDNWILVRLAEHGNIEQSIKEWNAMIGKYTQNGSQRQAPKVMGGQGGVPNEQVDVKQLRGKDRRSTVAAMLESLGP
jgi:hypothetical protein